MWEEIALPIAYSDNIPAHSWDLEKKIFPLSNENGSRSGM